MARVPLVALVFAAWGQLLSADRQAPVTPVEKVITLLEDLKGQIETDGTAEAGTYDTFACFCKSKTGTKSTSIIDGQNNIDTLSANIADDTATMEEKKNELQEKKTHLEQVKADLEAEVQRCLKEAAEFEATLEDLKKACYALDKAIGSMKQGKSFLQVHDEALGTDVLDAVKLGEALGLATAPTSLLQVDPNDPEYKFHSDSILDLLQKLKNDFDDKKTEVQAEYDKAKKICTKTKNALKKDIQETEDEITTLETDINNLKKSIADDRRSLLDAEAMMEDDKVYLRDLTAQCETAAKDWDQRSAARGKEIEALDEALTLLKNGKGDQKSIEDLDTDANRRALIQGSTKGVVAARSNISVAPAFVQQRALSVRSQMSDADTVKQVKNILQEAGSKLSSQVLMQLATKVGGDPFGKVKMMIQELIERLLAEAREEATKQGFCDKEMGKAYQNRDFRLEDAKKLAAQIGVDRSKNETLAADIEALQEALPKLYDDLNETTQIRIEEKEENLKRIKTAKEGFSAVSEAIVILKVYYRQAAKALLQRKASPVDEDTSGPGFSGPYRGQQESAKGIIGLLEVIKSDFDRTVRQTTAEEKAAQEEFVEFERVTKTDISGKEESLSLKSDDQEKVIADMERDLEELKTTQGLLDDALKTVESLTPMCLGWGQSYADRVQKRQDEIDALKRCLTILTPSTASGP